MMTFSQIAARGRGVYAKGTLLIRLTSNDHSIELCRNAAVCNKFFTTYSRRNKTPPLWSTSQSPVLPCTVFADASCLPSISRMPSHRHYATGDKSKDSTTKSGTSTESQNEDKTDLADADQPPKSPGILQRFKLAYKEYGKVLIGVHVATSVVWFGSFFYLAKSGLDVVPWLEGWNVSDTLIKPFRNPYAGNAAVAYLLYKLATPARYTVTIGGTQLTVMWLRRIGYMDPVSKEDSLRSFVKEGSAKMKEKREEIKDQMIERREEIKDQMKEKRDELKEKREDLKDKLKGTTDTWRKR